MGFRTDILVSRLVYRSRMPQAVKPALRDVFVLVSIEHLRVG